MGKPTMRIIRQAMGAAVCLGILLSALSGCKNSTTPDEPEEARILVRNNCGIAVDIYMDAVYQFFLEDKEYYYIENLTLGTHALQAKKKGTDTVLKSISAEITEKKDYTWTINSLAVITITNKYGETLSIYGDGTYQTDIDDQGTATIQSMPYGEHLFEAKRPSQTEVLASTSFEVLEDKEYTWTITK
jgi:hypothetical protein